MDRNNKEFIILIGPPGCGKGTQGTLLSEKLGLYLFETSRIIEDYFAHAQEDDYLEADGQRFYASAEAQIRSEGRLCSPPFVFELIKGKIMGLAQEGKSIITAGSPRTIYEAEKLLPILEELYGKKNIKVVEIQIPAEDSIFRNSHRRICELMRHSILYSEINERLEFCPIDGSKLIKRKGVGDDAETIKTRYHEYMERTAPLMDFFQESGIKTVKVNGSTTPADLFRIILEALI